MPHKLTKGQAERIKPEVRKREEDKEARRLETVNKELVRRQELIKLGLRQPSKEEQARAEIMGITPEQRQEREQIKEQERQEQILQVQAEQQPITAQELPPTGIVSEKEKERQERSMAPTVPSSFAARTSETLFKKIEAGEELTAEDTSLISQLQLNDLDIAQIQAGKTHISRLEEFVESVPIIGRRKRIAGVSVGIEDFVAETPSGRINKLLDSMQASKTNVVNWANEIKNNPQKASTYLPLIQAQEQEILTLQSRIKLMSIQQEKIQANPEIYDDIQKEINDILTKTGSAKTDLQMLGIR